ncbi:unnamed protein product, partial [Echinostoma caproni]|uniref:Uncharacterized protein n=1 Tax=Echinostoma caproni TaxID=27848 RepID=A0A183A3K2_9TREM
MCCRCARAVVSYRESDDQDDDKGTSDHSGSKFNPSKSVNRRRLAYSTDEDADPREEKSSASQTNESDVDRPPTPVSKRIKGNAQYSSARRRC